MAWQLFSEYLKHWQMTNGEIEATKLLNLFSKFTFVIHCAWKKAWQNMQQMILIHQRQWHLFFNCDGCNKIILWRCWMMSKEEEVRLKLIRISCCRLVSAVVNGHRLGFGYLRFCSTILRFDTKIELTVRKGYSNNKYDHYYILYLFSWAT